MAAFLDFRLSQKNTHFARITQVTFRQSQNSFVVSDVINSTQDHKLHLSYGAVHLGLTQKIKTLEGTNQRLFMHSLGCITIIVSEKKKLIDFPILLHLWWSSCISLQHEKDIFCKGQLKAHSNKVFSQMSILDFPHRVLC